MAKKKGEENCKQLLWLYNNEIIEFWIETTTHFVFFLLIYLLKIFVYLSLKVTCVIFLYKIKVGSSSLNPVGEK
jgi:hypothetical protein